MYDALMLGALLVSLLFDDLSEEISSSILTQTDVQKMRGYGQ